MHWPSQIPLLWAVLVPAVIQGCSGSTLKAQAWTPGKGEGTVSLTYQNYDVAGHYDARGRKNNNGGTQSHAAITEVDFGITDRISVIAPPALYCVEIHRACRSTLSAVWRRIRARSTTERITAHFRICSWRFAACSGLGRFQWHPSSPPRSRLMITRQSEKRCRAAGGATCSLAPALA